VFKIFDEDGNGFIEWEELRNVMDIVTLSENDYRALISQYDSNGDGKVCL